MAQSWLKHPPRWDSAEPPYDLAAYSPAASSSRWHMHHSRPPLTPNLPLPPLSQNGIHGRLTRRRPCCGIQVGPIQAHWIAATVLLSRLTLRASNPPLGDGYRAITTTGTALRNGRPTTTAPHPKMKFLSAVPMGFLGWSRTVAVSSPGAHHATRSALTINALQLQMALQLQTPVAKRVGEVGKAHWTTLKGRVTAMTAPLRCLTVAVVSSSRLRAMRRALAAIRWRSQIHHHPQGCRRHIRQHHPGPLLSKLFSHQPLSPLNRGRRSAFAISPIAEILAGDRRQFTKGNCGNPVSLGRFGR